MATQRSRGIKLQQDTCPIVGIGASAGGVEALSELVKAIPEKSGFAYVIIQHLSPDHPSIMDQVLGGHSVIPVERIEDGKTVEPDTIYVLPAGPSATIDGSTLHLHERDTEATLRTPIDQFLRSLAAARGRSAFCVILSGTGSDGTVGVRAIKEAGGFAMVQKSDSAQFPGMPDSAAATGLVDLALAPNKIPGRLVEILSHRDEVLTDARRDELRTDIETSLSDILSALRQGEGPDFSEYKPGTLIRRIERRIIIRRDRDVDTFMESLKQSAQERERLMQDFLIGVTQFFRDEEAFRELEQHVVLPLLKSDRRAFRIWVPGCSTGEEAYSIAILFAKAMSEAKDSRHWQVFGTDIDSAALAHARSGRYNDSQLDGLSQEWRERFLIPVDGDYQVSPQLRERCVFAPHNLLHDPPFSRLDLISCRNLLIYLTAEVQHSILPRFHYGLNAGGYLFLGPSETLGKQDRLFHIIDREARLYRRNDDEPRMFSTSQSPGADTVRRERRLLRHSVASSADMRALKGSYEYQLLNFFARQSAPPFATINANDEISYLSEAMSQYMRPAQGAPSAALDQFLLRDLRPAVGAAIREVRETGEVTRSDNVVVNGAGDLHLVDLEAAPVPFAEGTVLITLQPVRMQNASELAVTGSQESTELIERELAVTRQQLAATLDSYESTEQELKSSNEELLSMNEELQSSNEELETSREELQSINEELETVNAELLENNRQLLAANSDLKNLFESTAIATVFLDDYLCVRRYTPTARRLFGIQDRDLGRPLNDLKWKVRYDALEADAARVRDTLQPVEREVPIVATGELFLMRVRPYRREDNRIDGCVMTLVDITERKRVERQLADNAEVLARQYAELESLYHTTPVGLSLLDRDLRYLRINERLADINGIPAREHLGRLQSDLLPDIDAKVRDAQLRVLHTGEPSLGHEVRGVTPAQPDVERDWIVDFYPTSTSDGDVFAVGSCVTDVTEQKRLQRELAQAVADLQESESRLDFALRTSRIGAWEYDLASERTDRTTLHDELFGYDEMLPEWSIETFLAHIVQSERDHARAVFEQAVSSKAPYELVCRIHRADGRQRWIEAHGEPRKDAQGNLLGFLGTVRDITIRKDAAERQALLLDELQHRVKNTMATTLAIVQFSAKRATSVDAFTRTLRNRLQAISRTHELLMKSDWRGAKLQDVAYQEIVPWADRGAEQVSIEGANPVVNAKQILALTLAFHELATNAVKHGSLSVPEGRVAVSSRVNGEGMVELTWLEQQGPEVTEPAEADLGFGTFLLQRVVGADLEGTVQMEYRSGGILWRASFPLQGEV